MILTYQIFVGCCQNTVNMEKKLSLLRHGEAELGNGYDGDFIRKLSENGTTKLIGLSKALQRKGMDFDVLIKSPAFRTMQTAHIITEYIDVKEERIDDRIYESSMDTLLEILTRLPAHFERVLIVGHNPGLSSLLVYLTNEFNLYLSPGMMAEVTFDLPEWTMITKGSGSLVEVIQ